MTQLTHAQPSTVRSHISRVFHAVELSLPNFCSPFVSVQTGYLCVKGSILTNDYTMTKEKQGYLQKHILQALPFLIV
jgi:hypothetical protein